MQFIPDSINANSLTSDFLVQNNSMNLTGNNIILGNLDNVLIGGQPLNINNLSIDVNSHIRIFGNTSILGNITLNGSNGATDSICLNNYQSLDKTINIGGDLNISNSRFNTLYGIIIVGGDTNITDGEGDTTLIHDSSLISAGNINFNCLDDLYIRHDSILSSGKTLTLNSPGRLKIEIDIDALENITLTADVLQIYYGSVLTAGQNGTPVDGTLYINADGSIDPSSNIGATISGGIVNVENTSGVSGTGSVINITAPTITGTGTLDAKGGTSNINITNNSANNLTLNDLLASSGGQVIINGTPVTSYGDLTIITSPASDLGDINIANNSVSNVFINGNISGDAVTINNLLGNVIRTGSLISANYLSITTQNISNYLNLNVNNTTNLNAAVSATIAGKTAALTANTGSFFYYNNIDATSADIVSGGKVILNDGTITGYVDVTSNAPAIDGPAEIMLGNTFTDLAIGGNLNATTVNGNVYYYGGSVGGNAVINSAEAYDHRFSAALGRYRPLNITGNLTANTAGNFTYTYGYVGGDTVINAAKLAGILDVDFGGDLTANCAAFGYFGGTVGGNINIDAPGGSILGAGQELAAAGNVDLSSLLGSAGIYLGNINGYVNATAQNIVNIGNVDALSTLTFDWDGVTYDINDLPVPIPVDTNDLTIGSDLTIVTNGLVNFEANVGGNLDVDTGGQVVINNSTITGNANIDTTDTIELLDSNTFTGYDLFLTSDDLLVNANAELTGRNNVTIDCTGNVNILGTIESLGEGSSSTVALLINPDGSIDPSSDFGATIGGGIIDVDDVLGNTGSGGIIDITGNVTGTGTLIASGGSANIEITNNSTLDLLLNDLNTNSTSGGKIFVNGSSVTGDFGNITVIFDGSGSSTGYVDVDNNTSSNVLLAGEITAGTVNLANTGGSILRQGAGQMIYTANALFSAPNGSIGTLAEPILIDLTASTLNASAGGDINITEMDGDVTLGLVSGNTVRLTLNNGSIYDGNGGALNIDANNAELTALNLNGYVEFDITGNTTLNITNDAYISGTTGNLTANTGGLFYYNNINANSANIVAGGKIILNNGTIGAGGLNVTSNSPAIDGPAEIMLGNTFTDLIINGNLNATTTAGNIYYYGGYVGGNAIINSAEAYDHRFSVALGRYRPLNITGDLTTNTAGNFTYTYGSVTGNTVINAAKLAGILDVDFGGDLTANCAAFGYFGGTVGGNINIDAPGGSILGAGQELAAAGNVNIQSIAGSTGIYLANIAGYVDVTAGNIVNIGNVDELSTLTFDWNGITYDINDLPVPIPVDSNDLTVGTDLNIVAGGLVNFEGTVNGKINAQGDNVKLVVTNDANLENVYSSNLADITSLNGSILDARATEDANITAKDVILAAPNGTIGTLLDDLDIDLLASTLNITAGGDIFITEADSDIDAGLIQSLFGSVYLTALNGDINDDNGAGLNISGVNAELTAQNINGFLDMDISGYTLLNTINNTYISGTTGDLIANTGGEFHYQNINADSADITSGGLINLYNGTITGDLDLVSNAPAVNGMAEVNLGFTTTDLAIGGNLNATVNNGNLYFNGGSVGGNATIYTGESFDDQFSLLLGTLRPVVIGGNLDVTTPGNFAFNKGSIGNNADINVAKLAGINNINIGGNLDVNALGFGYYGGTVGGDVNVNAVAGTILGAGDLLNVTGDVNIITDGVAGYYLGSVGGNLNITADSIVNVGNIDVFSALTLDYGGTTYDINDLPYPIPVDNNNFTTGNNLNIATNGPVNFEGTVNGNINASGSTVDLFIIGNARIDTVNAVTDAAIISNGGSILDAFFANDANVTARNVYLESTTGSIGDMFNDFDIFSNYDNTGGSVTALANSGSIFLKQVGIDPLTIEDTDVIIVDTIQARDQIYLQADWQIQNYDGLIRTTGANSVITLATDDTKLWNEAPVGLVNEYGGTIDTGTGGKVIFKRYTGGSIWIGYTGPGTEDYDNPDHASCTPMSFVTDKELSTISSDTILAVTTGNVIIDDNYNFRLHPIDAGDEDIFILRSTPGDFHIGNFNPGLINVQGYIHQNEIYDSSTGIAYIKADNIHFGNVLDPAEWVYAITNDIYLYSPDFSHNSSSGRAANVTFVASNNILDGNTDVYNPLLAQDITLEATNGSIGQLGTGKSIDIYTLNSGILNASAYGVVSIFEPLQNNQYNKSLYVGEITSQNGSVQLAARSNLVDANGDDINISSYNDILLNIWYQYPYYSTTRATGSIGSADDFIEIDSAISGTGTLTAYSYYTYIEELSGDLNLNVIEGSWPGTANTVYLKANDPAGANILDANNQISSVNNYNIAAQNVTLEALYGSIGQGSIRNSGAIDIYGHTVLNAYAGTGAGHTDAEIINIDHSSRLLFDVASIKVGSIITNNNSTVNLNSRNGNIFDANVDLTTDIAAKEINLYAYNTIGKGYENNSYIYRPLEINLLDNTNGFLNATAFDYMNINGNSDLLIRDIRLNSNNALSSLYLTALNGRSILNAKAPGDTTVNINVPLSSPGVFLTADNNIGLADRPIGLNIQTGTRDYMSTISGGSTYLNNIKDIGILQVANSYAGGDYHLTSNNNVGLLRTTTGRTGIPAITSEGTLTIEAAGRINDYHTISNYRYTELPLLAADFINLDSGSSIGGLLYNDLDIQSFTPGSAVTLNATAETGIYITPLFGSLYGQNIVSDSGDIVLIVPHGGVDIDYISTTGNIFILSLLGINIDTIDPATIHLESQTSGTSINVNNAQASNTIELYADNVNANVASTGTSTPLNLAVQGSGGKTASNVTISGNASQGLNFNNLKTTNASINNMLAGSQLTLNNTTVSNQLNIRSDYLTATNNINLNKAAIVGYNSGTANTINLANSGNLTINLLNTNQATIGTSGSNLLVSNATVKQTGTFSNNSYVAVIDNTGNINLNGADIIMSSGDSFSLLLGNTNQIKTNANILAVSQNIETSGSASRPQINNDISQTTNTARRKILDALLKQSEKDNKSAFFSTIDPDLLTNEIIEKYAISILESVLNVYNESISNNEDEDEALKKAVDVLINSNFNPEISRKLLNNDKINSNSNYKKILEQLLPEISVKF